MKNIKYIVLSICVLALVTLGFTRLHTLNPELVKVGIILPLSGEVSSLGENAKNGALLAFSELSTSTKEKIQLIFEDDKFDAKNTVSAFNKLINFDKASIIICFASTPCAAVAPLADQQKIPLIAIASAPVQINHNYVVRLELSTFQEGKVLAQYLENKKYAPEKKEWSYSDRKTS